MSWRCVKPGQSPLKRAKPLLPPRPIRPSSQAGIYNQIAIPVKSGAWRNAGLLTVQDKMLEGSAAKKMEVNEPDEFQQACLRSPLDVPTKHAQPLPHAPQARLPQVWAARATAHPRQLPLFHRLAQFRAHGFAYSSSEFSLLGDQCEVFKDPDGLPRLLTLRMHSPRWGRPAASGVRRDADGR